MKQWILIAGLVLVAAFALAACSDSDDGNDETVGESDGLPIGSDGIDALGNAYRVTISFNEDAVQADIDEVGALLATYDDSADYLIQESFPPTGTADVTSDVESFCEEVLPEIESRSFVTVASCGPQFEPGDLDDANPDGSVTNGPQQEPDTGVSTSPVCAPGFPDCVDTIVNDTCLDTAEECSSQGSDGPALSDCEPVQLRSDCGIDPDVCNQVHNIDACTGEEDLPPATDGVVSNYQWQLTVRFNETVQQDHLDDVGARVRDFDPDAEYVIQESFPPTGVANFTSDTEDACLALQQTLEQESFVTSASCGPQLEPGDPDPDEPVVNDLN